MSQYDLTFDLKINVGYFDLFHGPVILPYIFKTIWYMNTILWYYESVWPNVWPKDKCRSLWPIFDGPVILPYIWKTVWCMNIILQDYESVWPDIDLMINVGHFDLYCMVQWFCLRSWRLFAAWTSYFCIMSQYDTTFDLKINVGHCDLYFMVQWFCLISWRLLDIWTTYFLDYESVWPDVWSQNKCRLLWPIFHGPMILPYILKIVYVWTSYFRIMSQYDPTFDFKINVGHCDLVTYISWSSDFALYLQDYLIYEHHTLVLWVSMTRCLT